MDSHCCEIPDAEGAGAGARGAIEAVAVYADGVNIQTEGGVVLGQVGGLLKPNVKAEARRNERRITALKLFEGLWGGFYDANFAKLGL